MSDSNHPTLPPTPPPAANTVLDLRGVMIDAVREVLAAEVTPQLMQINNRLTAVETELRKVNKKLDVLNDQYLDLRADHRLLDDRVTALEAKPT